MVAKNLNTSKTPVLLHKQHLEKVKTYEEIFIRHAHQQFADSLSDVQSLSSTTEEWPASEMELPASGSLPPLVPELRHAGSSQVQVVPNIGMGQESDMNNPSTAASLALSGITTPMQEKPGMAISPTEIAAI